MKQNTFISPEGFESTYALLVRYEEKEKERSRFEGFAYLVLILSAVFSIWHFAQQPIELPGVSHTSVAHSTNTNRT